MLHNYVSNLLHKHPTLQYISIDFQMNGKKSAFPSEIGSFGENFTSHSVKLKRISTAHSAIKISFHISPFNYLSHVNGAIKIK